ncbi:FtsK/SpoIIIE domain-containing protein [Clostridium butyricum]|uniref:FtsK/SpoIIIE domain-containing protein n=1 Tax=Clostridium butyricum TaxID=1492 RepID=UPI0021D602B0|nr:FtsK/SpoIIIE domain-containing protein [Clostridium butyricum]
MENIFNMIKNKKDNNSAWRQVKYPTYSLSWKLGFIPVRIIVLFSIILSEIFTISFLSEKFHGFIIEILFFILFFYIPYKTIIYYSNLIKKVQDSKNNFIEKALQYMIKSLKLYDTEPIEIEVNGKIKTEQKVVRSILIYYMENDTKVFIRVSKVGDRFTKMASDLKENLESALGYELDSTNSTVDYFEYVFLKFKDERIDLASSINNQEKNSDSIQISSNISFKLSKTPHSLIVGGTGSGKSFFILGKIVSYLNLTPQAELYVIDPKKADLSLLRFVDGLQDKVATEVNQIAKMLRKVVNEIMEFRYETYFNDISAFGKDYTDFGLPPVIIIFDEFSAFLHSVDKKLSKEVLDYIFTIVMKGRQAGVQVEILMQRPSADDLPTNIRSQMGFKAGLGAMDKIGYNMIFDTNDMDYKTVTEKGGGYIQIDGLHTAPVYFETPYIDKNFDFIGEITRLMNLKNKEEF